MPKLILIIISVFVLDFPAFLCAGDRKYEFKDFPAPKEGKLKKVVISEETKKKLKSIELSSGLNAYKYLKRKANFAYHYEVVEWSCGLPCSQALII